jgi:hypothetical protein
MHVSTKERLTMALREFNELVNMTSDELKEWLSGSDSQESGWSKDDGSGESIGHEVGSWMLTPDHTLLIWRAEWWQDRPDPRKEPGERS